jgi:hypothetical protein
VAFEVPGEVRLVVEADVGGDLSDRLAGAGEVVTGSF